MGRLRAVAMSVPPRCLRNGGKDRSIPAHRRPRKARGARTDADPVPPGCAWRHGLDLMRHAPDPQPQAWGLPPRDASATRPACELGAIDLYDSKGRLIERIELTGDHHSLAIDLAHVIPRMLGLPCRTVILRHAHPSGLPTPSETDVAATRAFAALRGCSACGCMIMSSAAARSGSAFARRGFSEQPGYFSMERLPAADAPTIGLACLAGA